MINYLDIPEHKILGLQTDVIDSTANIQALNKLAAE